MIQNVVQRHKVLLSAGVDWLTCSKSGGVVGSDFDSVTSEMLRANRLVDGKRKLATWQGYAGVRGADFFVGHRGDNALVALSGPHSPALVLDLIKASDNVSRIDLQVTVEHLPADPALGRINYHQLVNAEPRAGAKPLVTVIHNTKGGHTNAVGSRISDAYGRNYDKGVEGKLCEPGRLWRYEVEFKRGRAMQVAQQLVTAPQVEGTAARAVWRWWSSRGVQLLPGEPSGCLIDTRIPERAEVDYLRYFETNVQSSIRSAVRQHGLHSVLRALGLLNMVEPLQVTKGEKHDSVRNDISPNTGR